MPRGVLRISSNGDDQMMFWGLKFSILGRFGLENLANIFLCGLIEVGIFFAVFKII